VLNTLRIEYKYSYSTNETLKEMSFLIKLCLAKHNFGDVNPTIDKILKISNTYLPTREVEDIDQGAQ